MNFLYLLFFLLTIPLSVAAQFVEVVEEKEKPSEFSLAGFESFQTVMGVVNVLLAVLFLSSIIGLMASGVKFIIAGGGESTLGSARKTLIASLVGLVLSLVGYVIINLIKHYTN